jgi:CheY-like chemotaxis protein
MPKKTDSTTLFLSQIGNHMEEMANLLAVDTMEPIGNDDVQRAVRCTSMLSRSASLLELEGLSACLGEYQHLLEFYVDKRLRWDEKIAQLTSELIELEDQWVTDGEGQRSSALAAVFSTEQLAALSQEMADIRILAEDSVSEQAPEAEAITSEPEAEEFSAEPRETLAAEPETKDSTMEPEPEAQKDAGPGERMLDESTQELHRLTRELLDRRESPRWDPQNPTPETLRHIRRDLFLVGFYARSIEQMIGIKTGDPSTPRLESLAPVAAVLRDFSRLLCAGTDRVIKLRLTGEEHAIDVRLLSPVVRILQGMIGDIALRCTEKELRIEVIIEAKHGSLIWSLCDNGGNYVSDTSLDPDEFLAFYPSLRDTYKTLAGLHSLLWVEPGEKHGTRFAFSLPATPDTGVFVVWRRDEESFAVLSNQVSEILDVDDVDLERDASGDHLVRDGHCIPIIRLGEICQGVDVDGSQIVILGHVETRVAFYVNGAGDVVEGTWMRDAVPTWRGVRKGVAQIGDSKATVLEASDLLDRCLSLVNDANEARTSVETTEPAVEPSWTSDVSATQSAGSGEARRQVLIVERSEALRNELRSILAATGWEIEMVERLDSALDSLHDNAPTLIISEFRVPSMAARVLAERLKAEGSEIPVLVTTTHTGENAERLVQKLGVAGYIAKPLGSSDVLNRIRDVVGDKQIATAKT